MLGGIEHLGVEADDRLAVILEQRPGTGGEILQAGADGQNHIGLARQFIGCGSSGDADRAHVERVVMRQGGLAGLRLANRNAMLFCKLFQGPGRFANRARHHRQ